MGFSFDKVLAAFGNTRAMENTVVDNVTEDIINSIKDKPFAVSEQNVMYAAIKELGGYYYLKTIIVGSFKIKTMKGATLSISGNELDLILKTDMDEFESDHSNISGTYITRIDFQINEENVSQIDTSFINTFVLKAKKNVIDFKSYKD